jgi:ABC-type bacteriocin/lantibiotic exporter with double-glycine peptidase domain
MTGLHWDLNHFVVLKSVRGTAAVIHDPAAGVRRLHMTELSKHFTGVALELTPTGGFESVERPPRVRPRTLPAARGWSRLQRLSARDGCSGTAGSRI